MTVLAVFAGVRHGQTGGQITLTCLSLPLLLISLTHKGRWIPVAWGICAAGIIAELAWSGTPVSGPGRFWSAVMLVVLLGVGGGVAGVIRGRRTDALNFDEWCDQALHQPTWSSVSLAPSQRHGNGSIARSSSHASPAAVQFCVLLETLEDIGRLISINLDLDTLVPTIISTARSSLKCRHCDLYLWNANRRELVNPLAHEYSTGAYVPRADTGIGAWVIEERRVWTREHTACSPQMASLFVDEELLPDAVAPLTAGMEMLGLLVVDGAEDLSPNPEKMLSTLANIYGLGIRNALLFRRVEEMARHDGLTGLYNHAAFHEILRTMVVEAVRHRSPLTLVMSDIDFFKRFNDEFGHQTGDDVLREVARLWKAVMPDSAVLARYGGEEFIAAIPGADEERAAELAEFLRTSIEGHPFISNGNELHVTASFGVAELTDGKQLADDLVRTADQCLYEAKRSGRNRLVRSGDRPEEGTISSSTLVD